MRPTPDVTPSTLRPQKDPPYDLMSKSSDNQSFFINGSESWKISFSLFKLEDFILNLSMEVLEGIILALLLDNHVQVVKSWKISSLLFELKDFILALSIDMLEDLILVLLLETTGRERRDGRA